MKRVTNLIILTGASALAACASQAPAPPKVAATPPVIAASPVTAAATTSAASSTGNFKIPSGYKRVTINGQDEYCRYETYTGSRTEKSRVCMTLAQLEAEQSSAQQFLNQIDRTSATIPPNQISSSPGPGGH